MIVFHGTTMKRARRICEDGFLPKKPSKRVWFAESRAYAERRGHTQARRARDRSVVLTCDLDLAHLRHVLGANRVLHRNRVISINGVVPVSVLRSWPVPVDVPTTPQEIVTWLNGILRVKQHNGISVKHEGVQRLSKWIINRLKDRPGSRLKKTEVLDLARRWIPDYLSQVEIDPDSMHASRRTTTVAVKPELDMIPPNDESAKALAMIDSAKGMTRAKGLKRLAHAEDPDLFEWCALSLDDDSSLVQEAALKAMAFCEDVDVETVEPFADHEDKRLRAAAIALLGKHDEDSGGQWILRGLQDPQTNVRLEAVSLLPLLDPKVHREVFELALYDPHEHVQQRAMRMIRGKGFARLVW